MKNNVDAVKNDQIKTKCDWDREKKKLISEHETQIEDLKNQLEDDQMSEVRQAKDKADKAFKKKLQEKEALW